MEIFWHAEILVGAIESIAQGTRAILKHIINDLCISLGISPIQTRSNAA